MTDIDKNELVQSLMRLRKRCCGGVSAACMTTNARMAKDNAEFQKLIQGVKALIAERDEARRDRCMARAVIRWDLEHPNSPQRTETTIILLAWQIADEEGWDCFEGRKR